MKVLIWQLGAQAFSPHEKGGRNATPFLIHDIIYNIGA